MLLQINGAPTETPDGQSVVDLLASFGIGGGIAVEEGGGMAPRRVHALADGHRVEIVHAIVAGPLAFRTDRMPRHSRRSAAVSTPGSTS